MSPTCIEAHGSFSGRQLYMQYGMFHMHQCEQSGGQESVFETARQSAHTDAWKTYCTAYTAVSWGWTHELRYMWETSEIKY